MSVEQLRIDPPAEVVQSISGIKYVRFEFNDVSTLRVATIEWTAELSTSNPDFVIVPNSWTRHVDPLGSDPAIIVNDPRIQDVVKNLRSMTRERQVEEIISYVASNVKYRPAENNAPTRLNSSETMKDGHGSAGQLSAVFAALSRSLNIPTLQVSGYFVANGYICRNDWVEVNMSADQWKLVDIAQIAIAGVDNEIPSGAYIPLTWTTEEVPYKSMYSLDSNNFVGAIGLIKIETTLVNH